MAKGDTLFVLDPLGSTPTGVNFPSYGVISDGSTPSITFPVLKYIAASDQHMDWHLTMPAHYARGGFLISWKGSTDNTSIGTLILAVRCLVVSDGLTLTDDKGIDGLVSTDITDTPPTTPQDKINYSTTGVMSHTNAGSPLAGNRLVIRVSRDTTDTNTGVLQLNEVLIVEN